MGFGQKIGSESCIQSDTTVQQRQPKTSRAPVTPRIGRRQTSRSLRPGLDCALFPATPHGCLSSCRNFRPILQPPCGSELRSRPVPHAGDPHPGDLLGHGAPLRSFWPRDVTWLLTACSPLSNTHVYIARSLWCWFIRSVRTRRPDDTPAPGETIAKRLLCTLF